jgi:hypothetical protein
MRVHGRGQLAVRDRVEDLPEGLPGQVGGVAEVARQAHTLRHVLVPAEVPRRPLVGEAAAEAGRAMHAHRAQSVGQGRRADQIKGRAGLQQPEVGWPQRNGMIFPYTITGSFTRSASTPSGG